MLCDVDYPTASLRMLCSRILLVAGMLSGMDEDPVWRSCVMLIKRFPIMGPKRQNEAVSVYLKPHGYTRGRGEAGTPTELSLSHYS